MITATILFLFINFILIPGIICAIVIPHAVRNNKYTEFVKDNSVSLNTIQAINKNYIFFAIKTFNMNHNYDNENMYRDITCEDYLIYELVYLKSEILENIQNVLENQRQYKKYSYDVHAAMKFGTFKRSTEGMKEKKLIEIEKDLFQKEIRRPCIEFSLTVRLVNVDKHNHYKSSKNRTFSINEIINLVNRLDNKVGSYYRDNGVWESICRVERGKVSNKIRFAIYARDNYRCKICGKKGDNNDLEIDHIIPISKGGKSTFDNLQTLCHECNSKKGNTITYK